MTGLNVLFNSGFSHVYAIVVQIKPPVNGTHTVRKWRHVDIRVEKEVQRTIYLMADVWVLV